MRCPFLREAQVKFCRASAFRKMIVRLPGQIENERCSSPDHINCPAAKQHHEERPSQDHCPFLHESLVQYCAAASVTKYIPYSESVLSQCGTESHNYCELYLAIANPPAGASGGSFIAKDQSGNDKPKEYLVDGLRVPSWLYYSPNHMWLDVGADGLLHVGIDAFLAKVLGAVNDLTFMTTKGVDRPAVVFNVRGVDVQLVFPNPMLITKTNSYLRTNLSKIFSDPFTLGWLFEGVENKLSGQPKQSTVKCGLVSGLAACEWMQHELERMNARVHDLIVQPQGHDTILMSDGGGLHQGLMQHLNREEILQLFNEFFSPLANWKKAL